MNEAVITIQDKEKKTIQSPKSGKDLELIVLVSTDGQVFEGYSNLGDPEIGSTVNVKFKTINTKRGEINSLSSIGGAEKTWTKTAKTVATKAISAAKSSSQTPKEQVLGSTGKDLMIESQAILKSLIETGNYHSTAVVEGKTFLNLNTAALKRHLQDVHDLLNEHVNSRS